jgi:hypothetical protein
MKKRKKKESKERNVIKTTPGADHKSNPENETEKPFDFGGLPDRDLKKNMGCG